MNNIENILITSLSLDTMRGSSSPFMMIAGLSGIYVIKYLSTELPKFCAFIVDKCKRKVENNIGKITIDNGNASEIYFERDYESQLEGYQMADAIIDYVCMLNQTKILTKKNRFLLRNKDDIKINDLNIYIRLHQIIYMDDHIHLKSIKFLIYSPTLKLSILRKWCDDITNQYLETKQSDLLKYKYYFTEFDAKMKELTFTKTKFQTNKSLNNLFGEHIIEAHKRLTTFMDNKQWYTEKGIPYTLGFLLSGDPGCGKTSFIKAVANDTNRHIINIRLDKDMTVQQLHNLFNNTKINVYDNQYEQIHIPINQRIYVLEDADCTTEIVLKREYKKNIIKTEQDYNFEKQMKDAFNQNDKIITLGDLLNVLDGVLESNGRIIIMTSNHPSKLDPALIRPGRFDCNIVFKNCSLSTIKVMNQHYFKDPIDLKLDPEYDRVFTPAQVQEILLNNLYSPECIEEHFKQSYKCIKEKQEKEKQEKLIKQGQEILEQEILKELLYPETTKQNLEQEILKELEDSESESENKEGENNIKQLSDTNDTNDVKLSNRSYDYSYTSYPNDAKISNNDVKLSNGSYDYSHSNDVKISNNDVKLLNGSYDYSYNMKKSSSNKYKKISNIPSSVIKT